MVSFKEAITIVVPIDFVQRPCQLLRRSISFSKAMNDAKIRVVFGHNNRGSVWDKIFLSKVKSFLMIDVESIGIANVSMSALRNAAAREVKTDVICFFDVDLHTDLSLISALYDNYLIEKSCFVMAGCLYLTKKGTKHLFKNNNPQFLIASYFNYRRDLIQHLAIPSSVMLVKTKAHEELSGFDENYCGHGYEDFDYMLRLVSLDSQHNINNWDLNNAPYRAPLLASGFRAHLARYCFASILSQKMALHLYHEKKPDSSYYRAREKNANIFSKKFGSKNEIVSPMWLANEFAAKCATEGYNLGDYFVLFDSIPGYMWRSYSFYDHVSLYLKKIIKKITKLAG